MNEAEKKIYRRIDDRKDEGIGQATIRLLEEGEITPEGLEGVTFSQVTKTTAWGLVRQAADEAKNTRALEIAEQKLKE